MNKIKKISLFILAITAMLIVSCHDNLDDLNTDPNGINPETTDLNLMLPAIQVDFGVKVVSLGFSDPTERTITLAGVVQQTQKDGWVKKHNDYGWDNNNQSWNSFYDILRTNAEFYNKAVAGEFKFQQAAGLLYKSLTFGLITDLWGDAPYSESVGQTPAWNAKPAYDNQEDIYNGILKDLETANTLLSECQELDIVLLEDQDVMYQGNVMLWRKFVNSVALRYFMRLGVKSPAIAEAGIKKIISNPTMYPLILTANDDATIDYMGVAADQSWPTTREFVSNKTDEYTRIKMCTTFVEALYALNDPRLPVWADPVEITINVVPGSGIDTTDKETKVRTVSQDVVDKYETEIGHPLDQNEYVGLPVSMSYNSAYNMTKSPEQGVHNEHVSQLNSMYTTSSGDLLKMRIISAAEVNFILAEAAQRGWISGAQAYYEAGIQESLNAWGVGDEYLSYITNAGVPYDNTLEQIITQKWIASWSAAAEAWFDYRRTGFPDFQVGEQPKRKALPLRFYYNYEGEISLNEENAYAAIDKLTPTMYNEVDGKNSAWSKMWLLEGTGFPY